MDSAVALEITNSIMNTLQVIALAYIAVLAQRTDRNVS